MIETSQPQPQTQTYTTTTQATFGQTVFDRPAAAPQPAARTLQIGTMLKVGAVVVVPFVLGIVATTYLMPSSRTALLTQPAPQPVSEQQPVTLEQLVNLSLGNTEVTRNTSVDLLETPHPIANVLAGLTPQASPTAAQPTAQPVAQTASAAEDEAAALAARARRNLSLHMRMLREGVLAGVYTVKNNNENGAYQLILNPINVELSRGFVKQLLSEAEKRGDITFPKGLSTSSGNVDLDTMLFNLVQNSLANDGTIEGAEAAREMTRRAFAAANQEGVEPSVEMTPAGDRSYTVQSGDSLAYISLKFYGEPGAYTKIFEANRAVLRTPDRIRVGQKLVIPG